MAIASDNELMSMRKDEAIIARLYAIADSRPNLKQQLLLLTSHIEFKNNPSVFKVSYLKLCHLGNIVRCLVSHYSPIVNRMSMSVCTRS